MYVLGGAAAAKNQYGRPAERFLIHVFTQEKFTVPLLHARSLGYRDPAVHSLTYSASGATSQPTKQYFLSNYYIPDSGPGPGDTKRNGSSCQGLSALWQRWIYKQVIVSGYRTDFSSDSSNVSGGGCHRVEHN